VRVPRRCQVFAGGHDAVATVVEINGARGRCPEASSASIGSDATAQTLMVPSSPLVTTVFPSGATRALEYIPVAAELGKRPSSVTSQMQAVSSSLAVTRFPVRAEGEA
jgi:hypothetical protein